MSESMHTPGPWWYGISNEPELGPVPLDYESGGHCQNAAIFGADGTEIVGCDEYHVFNEEDDVRLMIAAPVLLAALNEARLQLEYLNEKQERGSTNRVLAQIVSAIAKAEGQ